MRRYLPIVFFFSFVALQSQHETRSEKELTSITLDSLNSFIAAVFDEDYDVTYSYSKLYLKHSKQKKEKGHIAKAYSYLIMSSLVDEALLYCDSLIIATKDFNTEKYPAFAHYTKAEVLYTQHRYKEALASALDANNRITSKTSKYNEYVIKNGIASMSANNNQHELAVAYYNKSLKYFKKQNPSLYITTLFGLAEGHLALKNLDSVGFYIKEGHKAVKKETESYGGFFTMTSGRLAYQRGNYITARDSLNQSLPILHNRGNLPNLAINVFWLGKTEASLGNQLAAMEHYKTVDSIFGVNKSAHFELRSAWSNLIAYYNKIGDTENELKYARNLIVVDSILNKELGFMANKITNEFVLPEIEQKNQEEKLGLEKSKKKITTWAITLATLLGISGISFFLYRKNELKKSKDYELVIERLKKDSEKPKPTNKTLELKKELIDRIEKGLNLFEVDQSYTKQNVSLRSVAKTIGTNPKYLSQYINFYKQVSFPDYLNNLRIKYVLKRLEQSFVERDDRFRIWSMSDVAEAAGFGSREYYAKAFSKFTNMKHRDYVRQLEKTHKKDRNS